MNEKVKIEMKAERKYQMSYKPKLITILLGFYFMLFSTVSNSSGVDYSQLKPEMFNELSHDQQFSDNSGSYKIVNSATNKGVLIAVTVNGKTRWKRHGAYYSSRKDGSVSRLENYRYGVKEGVDESYRKDGSVEYRYIYIKGRKHGLHEVFDKKGRVNFKVNYVDGRKNGVAIRYEGKNISTETDYKDGKRHGEYRQYGRRGKQWVLVARATYQNGKRIGKTEWF